MNPFQSIANYLDNDLYRWENDEERKRRYDEMYPMGDAHLGEWDQLSRARVRRNLAPGFQHWDEGAEDTGPTPERPKPYPIARGLPPYYPHLEGTSTVGLGGPRGMSPVRTQPRYPTTGYDASVQENVLETIIKQTPTGTTITKKVAPTPASPTPSPADSSRNSAHVQSMLDRHYQYNRGEPDLPVSWDMPNKYHRLAEGPMPPPGQMTYLGTPTYDGPGARGFTPPPVSNVNQFYEGVIDHPVSQLAIGAGKAIAKPFQAISDWSAKRDLVTPLKDAAGRVMDSIIPPAGASSDIPLGESDEGYFSPDSYINDMTRIAQGLPSSIASPKITNDVYTDAVVDFVGRDAERDETGMKDWYSQMAREAIRKFNGLPADEAVTPVYKRKASGPSKRTKNTGTTSKSKKKQRGRGRRY